MGCDSGHRITDLPGFGGGSGSSGVWQVGLWNPVLWYPLLPMADVRFYPNAVPLLLSHFKAGYSAATCW